MELHVMMYLLNTQQQKLGITNTNKEEGQQQSCDDCWV